MGYQSVPSSTTHVLAPHDKSSSRVVKTILLAAALLTCGILVGALVMHYVETDAANGAEKGDLSITTFVKIPRPESAVGSSGFAECDEGCILDSDCAGTLECYKRISDENMAMLGCDETYEVAKNVCIQPTTKKAVCLADKCVGTLTNTIPVGAKWDRHGAFSTHGCCTLLTGACELCSPPTKIHMNDCTADLTLEKMAPHCPEHCGTVIAVVNEKKDPTGFTDIKTNDCEAQYTCQKGDGKCSACEMMVAMALILSVVFSF